MRLFKSLVKQVHEVLLVFFEEMFKGISLNYLKVSEQNLILKDT